MKFLRQLVSSLSLYSRIPMPNIKRDSESTGREIMFLPLVGLIIAVVLFLVVSLESILPVHVSAKAVFALLVPLLITGGFHIDGFMDTVDALSSYQSQERKLEILKDPHVGSFAVIKFVTATVAMYGCFTVMINIETTKQQPVVILACGIFVISRALAGFTSLYIKKARPDGMLVDETKDGDTLCTVVLACWLIAALAAMAYIDAIQTGVIALAFIAFTAYYTHMVKKNFGGVTGDTAGYYVTMSEVFAIVVLVISKLITLTVIG